MIEQLLVYAIVAVAAGLTARAAWRRVTKPSGCGCAGESSCAKTPQQAAAFEV